MVIMTGRWVVSHRAPVMLVRGLGSGQRLRAWGFKPLWSPSGQGHVIDDRHLPDVLAHAQVERIVVRVEGVSADVSAEGRRAAAVRFHAEAKEKAKEFLEVQQAEIRAYRERAEHDGLCHCENPPGGPLPDALALLGAVEIGHEHHDDEVGSG